VNDKTTIIGDIHGQVFDLLHFFKKIDKNSTMLFLGDYVDRGLYGIEVLIFLFALKINKPSKVYLLRGNHESRSMTEFFTFREECMTKYSSDIYDMFMDSFDLLPLVAVVNKEFLCTHGGISPELKQI